MSSFFLRRGPFALMIDNKHEQSQLKDREMVAQMGMDLTEFLLETSCPITSKIYLLL